MNNLSNINIKGLSKKLKIKGGLAMLGLATIMSVTACSPKTTNNDETTIENESIDSFDELTKVKPTLLDGVNIRRLDIENLGAKATEDSTEEETLEDLNVLSVERFSKLVDEIMEENKELDFNVRRESIETLLYVCNMSMATPELSKMIESRFSSEEAIINSILETITSYDMNMIEAWYSNTSKHADLSKLFLDEIDKDAISYVQDSYDMLANNINDTNLEEESRNDSVNKFMDEIIDYSLYNGKINGYTNAELTSGASLVMSLLTTDGNSYLATTGLVNNYQNEINIMSTKDMEIILSQLYGELNTTLNSKSSLEECFEESTSYTK